MPSSSMYEDRKADPEGNQGGAGGDAGKEGAERRAIADIFRAVDLDANGKISEEELLKAVRKHERAEH